MMHYMHLPMKNNLEVIHRKYHRRKSMMMLYCKGLLSKLLASASESPLGFELGFELESVSASESGSQLEYT